VRGSDASGDRPRRASPGRTRVRRSAVAAAVAAAGKHAAGGDGQSAGSGNHRRTGSVDRQVHRSRARARERDQGRDAAPFRRAERRGRRHSATGRGGAPHAGGRGQPGPARFPLHPAGRRSAAPGRQRGRHRHPHRARGKGAALPLPHRRASGAGRGASPRTAADRRHAREDHGRDEHLREPRAAGRPHRVRRRTQESGHARVHVPDRARRDHRLPHPGQGGADRRPGPPEDAGADARDVQARHHAAQRHHPGDRAHGLGKDDHALFGSHVPEPAGHEDHHAGRPGRRRSIRPRASPSPRVCGRSCARIRTSSWSARSATWRRPSWPSGPR